MQLSPYYCVKSVRLPLSSDVYGLTNVSQCGALNRIKLFGS